MLVEKAGKAVFLIRRENSPTELIPDVRGFGHSFPEAFTTWDSEVKNSASHQRVIKYGFGGMKLLVRFEADGYLDGDDKKDKSSADTSDSIKTGTSTTSDATQVDEIAHLLSGSDLSPPQQLSPGATSIQLKNVGHALDQSQIFDLKTRSIRTVDRDHLEEELPWLWISQIPNFVLAFHTSGLFRKADIHIRDARDAVQSWEAEHETELVSLAALIRHIVHLSLTSSVENGKLELTLDGSGRLDVREQLPDAGDVLSADLKLRWESVCGSTSGEPETLGHEEDGASDGGVVVETSLFDWKDAGGDLTNCSEHCGYCGSCV